MFALVLLAILLGYLAVAVTATTAIVFMGRQLGWSRSRRWLTGACVAMVFYLIPFWDWIPTVIAHRYYCATEAKFEIHKTVDQWKKENAGIFPSLHYDPRAPFTYVGEYRRFPLNERMASEGRTVPVFLSIRRQEGRVIDMKTGDVLASYADFAAGYAELAVGGEGSWKFWLMRPACGELLRSPRASFAEYENEWSTNLGRK